MKKLIPIFSTIIMAFMFTSGHCATYYMRADGTAAIKGAATACGAASTAMSIATMNGLGDDFSAGDIFYYCDDGGEYNNADDIIRCFSAGSSGNEIIHMNAPGDTPVINGADTVAIGSWTAEGANWFWQPPANGAGATIIEPMQVWEDDTRLQWKGVCSEDGTTACELNSDCTGTCDDGWTGANNPVDANGEWTWDDTNDRVYIRPTDGTLNDEIMEVGQRCSGIVVSHTSAGTRAKQDNEYIIIDGIQVEKIAACGDDKDNPYVDGAGDRLAYSIIVGGGTKNVIRNCIVKQMGGGKYYASGTTSNWSNGIEFYDAEDCTANDNTIYDGHCVGLDPETTAAGATVGYICYDNYIYDIDGIGFRITQSGGTYYNNRIVNCGINHGTVAMKRACELNDPIAGTLFYNNWIENSYILMDIQNNDNGVLKVYCNIFTKYSNTGVKIQNDADDVNFLNNVVYDSDGASWGAVVPMGAGAGASNNVVIKNNILFVSTGKCIDAYQADTAPTISNNCYLRENAGNAFNWAGTDYTYANFADWVAASSDANSIAADPKFRDAANGDFALLWGSPCINAGANLGASYDDAFDPRDPTFPYDMLDQDLYGAWEIGAFVYVRRYEISKRANEMYLNMGLIQ